MGAERVPEQAVLREHVYLVHRALLVAVPLAEPSLPPGGRATQLPQLVVVPDRGGEAEDPDGETDGHARAGVSAVPAGREGGAVAGEPAGEGEGVEELEGPAHEQDERVDGGHAGVEEGGEEGAVEVVGYLEGISLCWCNSVMAYIR